MTLKAGRTAKVSVLTIAGAALLLSWGVFQTRLVSATVIATWSYDYTPLPACSATRATNCIDHFEVLDITSQDFSNLASAPNPPSPVGRIDRISVTFKYGPPFGQRTIAVIAVGKGPAGLRTSSNPYAARATALIRPGRAVTATILSGK